MEYFLILWLACLLKFKPPINLGIGLPILISVFVPLMDFNHQKISALLITLAFEMLAVSIIYYLIYEKK